jgi:four helix bundle protein
MQRTNFENLRAYKLTEELSDAIWEITVHLNGFERDTVGKQIVRSADSIGANIAEAQRLY